MIFYKQQQHTGFIMIEQQQQLRGPIRSLLHHWGHITFVEGTDVARVGTEIHRGDMEMENMKVPWI